MLTTLQSLKDYLKITTSDDDSLLTSAIEQASSFITDYCNREFEAQDYQKRMDWHGEDEFILDHFPVNSLSSFQYNTGTLGNPIWEDYDTDSYMLDNEKGIISLTCPIHRGIKNIKVEYNAGYIVIPADIQRACIRIASYIYNWAGRKTGVKKEQVDGASIEYDTTGEGIEKEIYMILNKYKKYV